MSKYHNRRTVIDDMVFDSRAEARRWQALRLLERAGVIEDLRRQVPYELIPGLKWSTGQKVRATVYKADFVYTDLETGEEIVEDVKGVQTKEYKLKKKLMKWRYGIEIREVKA